jgi:hypothetical protein
MASIAKIQNQNLPQQPYILSRIVYCALSPLDQIAARALEKCGLVRIVDEKEENSPR